MGQGKVQAGTNTNPTGTPHLNAATTTQIPMGWSNSPKKRTVEGEEVTQAGQNTNQETNVALFMVQKKEDAGPKETKAPKQEAPKQMRPRNGDGEGVKID